MSEECKEIEKQAKQLEKEDLDRAITLYEEAGQCYVNHDDDKHGNSNFEKAAKLLVDKGKMTENPEIALPFFERASSIFKHIDKEKDADKAIDEAHKKFIDVAKNLQSEARKTDDLVEAEQKFAKSSDYYKQGGEEDQSRDAWIDSGDKFYKAGDDIDDPIKALDRFNHAVANYRRGEDQDKEHQAMYAAAAKFYSKGEEILKDRKNLVMAYYNFIQAINIFVQMGEAEKQVKVEERTAEISEIIGMPNEVILKFLRSEGLPTLSIIEPEEYTKSAPTTPMETKPEVQAQRTPVSGSKSDFPQQPELSKSPVVPPSQPEMQVQKTQPSAQSIPASRPTRESQSSPQPSTTASVLQPSPARSNEEQFPPNTGPKPDFSGMQRPPDKPAPSTPPPTQTTTPSPPPAQTHTPPVSQTSSPSHAPEPAHTPKQLSPQTVQGMTPQKPVKATPKYDVPTSGPIIDVLHKQGYIGSSNPTAQELAQVPEYEILSIIIQYHPISLEDIETMTDIISISMVLSNLTADRMIEQTSEFKYTITQAVKDLLSI